MVTYDRDAVLAAVDLPTLADELLGDRRGHHRSATWRCPNPDHEQTGRTPPVTVFATRWGESRWHCHGCGNGGTAIDLVVQVHGVDPRTALHQLASRTGVPVATPSGSLQPARRRLHALAYDPRPVPALERYVNECAEALWELRGEPIRRWLTEARHLPEDVLRRNRIGADLGPRHQPRPGGVPRVRRAAVLPVLAGEQACYVQLRTLNAGPDFPRYLACRDELASNPRLALVRPARSFGHSFETTDLLITEGIIDALSAAAAGYRAAAYLGAGLPDAATAAVLARSHRRLVIAFDPDPPGRAAAYRLGQLLRARGRDAAVMDLKSGDLNTCHTRSTEWPLELAARLQHATAHLPRPRCSSEISRD